MKPRLLVTLGDVAGVGPEIVVKGWPGLFAYARPIVVGDPDWLRRTASALGTPVRVREVKDVREAEPTPEEILCLPATEQNLSNVQAGRVCGEAGRAAYDFLCRAIDETLANHADGIVTAPLHKEGLHAGGVNYPGHTEILADRTGTRQFAMMLYARNEVLPHGLGVLHVTLHMALRDTIRHITQSAIEEKIHLLADVMGRLCNHPPRLAVAALNPHASDGGLFGDEEARLIAPAVRTGQAAGLNVSGPWPSDTLFVRARRGDFDGIVAMYHNQGHIPLKLLAGFQAVNISVGLPIIRTSVAHGTAYDIAGQGLADPASLLTATRVAAQLAESRVES